MASGAGQPRRLLTFRVNRFSVMGETGRKESHGLLVTQTGIAK
jgi:hypothetical protein